jgi:hypothetical protein
MSAQSGSKLTGAWSSSVPACVEIGAMQSSQSCAIPREMIIASIMDASATAESLVSSDEGIKHVIPRRRAGNQAAPQFKLGESVGQQRSFPPNLS